MSTKCLDHELTFCTHLNVTGVRAARTAAHTGVYTWLESALLPTPAPHSSSLLMRPLGGGSAAQVLDPRRACQRPGLGSRLAAVVGFWAVNQPT